jgi:excisionase family DNA binding protein
LNIEERITKLEQDNIELKERIDMLSRMEHYVTPADLAKIMNCSKNHIYIQIRSGAIQAVTVGAAIRIPMSQFEMNQISNKRPNRKQYQPEIQNEKRSIEEIRKRVFE